MPLFGSSKKSPQEIGRILADSLRILTDDPNSKKSRKGCRRCYKATPGFKEYTFWCRRSRTSIRTDRSTISRILQQPLV